MLVEAGLLRAEVLFMKQSVLYDAPRSSVEAAGKSLDHEVRSLFVSPVLATALLDVGATFGTTPAAVSAALQAQDSSLDDISNDQMLTTWGGGFDMTPVATRGRRHPLRCADGR